MRYHRGMSPAVSEPLPTIFSLIGGAEPLRALVDRFYDLMDLEPEFLELRKMHPRVLDGSRDKLYSFCQAGAAGLIYTLSGMVPRGCAHAICHMGSVFLNVISGCLAWRGLCRTLR